ncbi:MAG: hypothetical protein HQL66_07235 [Magnetococcales bacterium]|nr:hypothetical protein [Magnetococcales bacterium]
MARLLAALLLALLLPLCVGHVEGAPPLTPERVPEPLKPWVSWVLHDHDDLVCPIVHNDAKRRFCTWPSRLVLELENNAGRFSQEWQIVNETWVPVPGGGQGGAWPDAVQVDGKPAAVTTREGKPGVTLGTGTHRVTGTLNWKELPESLFIAPASGLVDLIINGKAVPYPNLDRQGQLWLHPKRADARVEDHLEVVANRLIKDGVPVTIETRLSLRVAGKNRDLFLTPPLEGLIPLRLTSPLPARLESDGRLRVQARPGNWEVTLEQRSPAPVASLELPKTVIAPWPEEELWAFQADPALRLVSLTGAESVDPQQTLLPKPWHGYPTYLMHPGGRLTFVEKRRGNPEADPDRLTLHRTLWLDFDGGGFAFQDRLRGNLSRSWRLEMNPPIEPGRVEVNGGAVLITRLPAAERSGVEVRKGNLDLIAEGRLANSGGVLPAVGWEQDVQSLTALLHLPPGWRLFHAAGVDLAQQTWISRWTLLDLFLTLILAMAAHKLWGPAWGAVTLLTLTLVYHEERDLVWPLASLMATVALLRVMPAIHAVQRAVALWRNASLLVLVLMALPFLVAQAQHALYPQLDTTSGAGFVRGMEVGHQAKGTNQVSEAYAPDAYTAEEGAPPAASTDARDALKEPPAPAAPAEAKVMAKKRDVARAQATNAALAAPSPTIAGKPAGTGGSSGGSRPLAANDPNARIQTGQGIPLWQWHSVALRWNGPVLRAQQLHLYLMPPLVNRALNVLRIVLLLALLARVVTSALSLKRPWSFPGGQPGPIAAALALFLLGQLLVGSATPARAEGITPELLQTLENRLTAPPTCLPACADLPRMNLEVGADVVRLLLEVHAEQTVAIPLPGNTNPQTNAWRPSGITLDGGAATHLQRDPQGTLWIRVPPGVHQIFLEGAPPPQEAVQIPLPLPPHRVTLVRAIGWQVEGILDHGGVNSALQLRRLHTRGDPDAPIAPEPLPPFVQLERHLILDLQWRVETRVKRLTPTGSALLLEIPLLAGESVTSANPPVTAGRVKIHLRPEQNELTWNSILESAPTLTLKAAEGTQWVELWHLDVSPVWHVTHAGIPVIRHQDSTGQRQPEWRPWPGETVTLQMTRPEGAAGPTLTLEKSDLSVTPGMHATDVQLTLHLRSSQGGQHAIRLPPGAELLSAHIQGREEPIRQDGQTLFLPIVPGQQVMRLDWRQPEGIGRSFTTPQVDLGLPGVNATVQLHIAPSRWLFWVSGPALGPAILYWGVLITLLVLAPILGRLPWTPLKTWHWVVFGLGVSTMPLLDAPLVLFAWFLLLGWRRQTAASMTHWRFNLRQILLVVWSFVAISALLNIVTYGLLSGLPHMKVMGNLSSIDHLRWFQDRTGPILPQGHVISLSLFGYRLAMLLWAIWLAAATLGWIRWGWGCFTHGGLWQEWRAAKMAKYAPPATPPPDAPGTPGA